MDDYDVIEQSDADYMCGYESGIAAAMEYCEHENDELRAELTEMYEELERMVAYAEWSRGK